MVQNSKMKTIGKGLLSWAAVIVLVVSVIIFTTIKGTAFFSVVWRSLVAGYCSYYCVYNGNVSVDNVLNTGM